MANHITVSSWVLLRLPCEARLAYYLDLGETGDYMVERGKTRIRPVQELDVVSEMRGQIGESGPNSSTGCMDGVVIIG